MVCADYTARNALDAEVGRVKSELKCVVKQRQQLEKAFQNVCEKINTSIDLESYTPVQLHVEPVYKCFSVL